MAIAPYLAMTAAEYANTANLPPRIAWMACHFSAYATGLSNMPQKLPKEAMLIVNDITPIHRHNLETIAMQLCSFLEYTSGCVVLLDFQRVPGKEILALTQHLLETLPCPVAVSEPVAKGLSCPVFLPPCPAYIPLEEYISPWQDREIWLEIAKDVWQINLTEEGATYIPGQHIPVNAEAFFDSQLQCHYQIETASHSVNFTLWRTQEDIDMLLAEAEKLGIAKAIGLYQEFGQTL